MLSIAGIVLAGGQSTRMGTDKSKLLLNNQTLLERSKHLLSHSGIKSTFISGKQGIADKLENKGPLAGLIACLNELENFEYLLFTPVDMPLLNPEIIGHLIQNSDTDISHYEKHMLPVVIKNTKAVRKQINKQLKTDNYSLKKLYSSMNTKIIPMDYKEENFINTNNQSEWKKVRLQLQGLKQ